MSEASDNGIIVFSKLMRLAVQVVAEQQVHFAIIKYQIVDFVSVVLAASPGETMAPPGQSGKTIFTNHSSV